MLPTNEKAKLVINENHYLTLSPSFMNCTDYQNLYIISDEEIKEGEILPYLMKWENGYELFNSNNGIRKSKVDKAKRIIATTDKSLNLPQPSSEFIFVFIREYNKGNVIEDVMVEYDGYICDSGHEMSYKTACVYPHCDKPNYPKLKVDKNNYITITRVKDSWNREEVTEILDGFRYYLEERYGYSLGLLDSQDKNWIEQNL